MYLGDTIDKGSKMTVETSDILVDFKYLAIDMKIASAEISVIVII